VYGWIVTGEIDDSELSDEPDDADVMPYNADQIEAIIGAAEG
jgi:integrase